MKLLDDLEKEKKFLQMTDRPVVIWGTMTAGQMAYELCRDLHVEIAAFGDNNPQRQGTELFDIEILSAQAVSEKYPNAVIIIGSILYNIESAILQQLSSISKSFTFIGRVWIEYYYEVLIMKRNVTDKELFLSTLNDIVSDKSAEWRFQVNHKVIAEYQYIVSDYECEDLFDVLQQGYGIKFLYLIVQAGYVTDKFAELVRGIHGYNNIGHIILVTDGIGTIAENVEKQLRFHIFYYKISLESEKTFLEYLTNKGNHCETTKVSKTLFHFVPKSSDKVLTERTVCEAVYSYINRKGEGIGELSDKKIYIVQLFNGLANQMLMVLFGKMLEMQSDRLVIFDDTVLALDILDKKENVNRISQWFGKLSIEEVEEIVKETRKRNSFYHYERAEVAEVFSTPMRLLSDYFDSDTWNLYLGKVKEEFTSQYIQAFPLGQLLLKQGMDITLMRDKQMPIDFLPVKNCLTFDTQILELPYQKQSVTKLIVSNDRNTYYMGVWTMGRIKDWLFTNRKFVREIYSFHIESDQRNLDYIKKIKSTEAVMLHIRRGDFVLFHTTVDNSYFRISIQKIEKIESKMQKHYFIFSDDIDWCKSNNAQLGLEDVRDRVTYITGNEGKNSYIDMYLMSLGKILVPSYNSTFGYLALLLSESMEKCVDAIQYEYYSKMEIYDRVEIVEIKN